MWKRSYSRILSISALLLMVLFKFQNCAPAPNLASGGSSQVGIVDQYNPTPLTFLNDRQTVPVTNSTVDLQGLCVGSANGQQIEWQIINETGEPSVIQTGLVDCQQGEFQFSIQNLQINSCSESFQVRATRVGDDSQFAQSLIQVDCSGS